VWSTDARSAQIGGPDCISQSFQVSANSGEPSAPSLACNLLAKRDCRVAEGDEVAEDRPEMSFVGFAFALSRLAERLAGT
jgi:hypothetical protein